MTIKGGLNINNKDVVLSLTIGGGRPYKRVYNDVVSNAIMNFEMNSHHLSNDYKNPIYLRTLKQLFQYAHVDIINGDNIFQINYNIWMLNAYVKMLLESQDMKLIAQMLNLDNILYSVAEAGILNNDIIETDFSLPSKLSIDNSCIDISIPKSKDIEDVVRSLNDNIHTLVQFMKCNDKPLKKIHDAITSATAKHLTK